MIFCARATRGLRRPSLDARRGRSIRLHPQRETSELGKSMYFVGRRARAFRFSPLRPRGSSQIVLHCAHRTSTVSSCAFCEQEGWSGCSPPGFLTAAGGPCYPEPSFTRISAYFQVNRHGAVAQLGARVNGIHEVAGSIPASSTNFNSRQEASGKGLQVRVIFGFGSGSHAELVSSIPPL